MCVRVLIRNHAGVEELRVKYILLISIFFLFSPVHLSGQVTGPCSDCHTMHNSQNNALITPTPQDYLLKKTCVGCHTGTNSSGNKTPYVYSTSAPIYNSNTLAGGNFFWVMSDSGKGHNCLSIPGMPQDSNLSKAPGWHGTGEPTDCQVCHGSHTGGGMYPEGAHGDCNSCHSQVSSCKTCHKPAHHADDSANLVGENQGWYRFLISPNHPDPVTGVKGIEDNDWEFTKSSSDHNEYYGSTAPGRWADNSMSHFCAGCHGNFHGIAMSSDTSGGVGHSPWLRHPTYIALPNSGEYKLYNTTDGSTIGEFSNIAPIARDPSVISGMSNASANITPGSDQVMCLSCHRAHGSPYADMMRWDYLNGCSAGTQNSNCGCFVCHTAKDD